MKSYGYYCYEEDSDISIPLLDNADILEAWCEKVVRSSKE